MFGAYAEKRTLRPRTRIGHSVCGCHWIWKERNVVVASRNGTSCGKSDDVENKNNARLEFNHTVPTLSSHDRHVTAYTLIHVISLLSAFIPLVQGRLSNSRHHLSYFLFLHHAFIAHEFLRCACRNRGHTDKDFGSDQVFKGLGSHFSSKCPEGKEEGQAAYRHQDLLGASHHANTTSINLNGSRLRCQDLLLKGVVQHLKCN